MHSSIEIPILAHFHSAARHARGAGGARRAGGAARYGRSMTRTRLTPEIRASSAPICGVTSPETSMRV